MKKTLIALATGLMLSIPVYAAEKVDITILATSDIHGVFIPWDYSSDAANTVGSLSQISAQVKKIRAETPNVILIDVGDAIQGNFIETFKDQEISPMILGFNAMNYDFWIMGNHEFDFGLDVLARSIDQFKGTVLTGNIFHDDGSRFLPAYKIIEQDGVKLGIIGMSTPMTAVFAEGTDRVKGLKFTNPTEEVQKVVKELEGKVDAIVLVSHMGVGNENNVPNTGNTDIANGNAELDAILAGHMHVKIDKEVVNGVIITEPAKYGEALSRVDLKFEKKDGKFQLVDKNSYTYAMKGLESDKELEAIFDPYHKVLRENANKPIAKLVGRNLVPPVQVKGIPQGHIQDTGISALYQEASGYYAPMADIIALQIDNDYPKLDVGDIRMKDIAFNYQYKGGEISVYQLTGKELKKYMEWAVDYFNQIKEGDVTYSFNPTRRSSKYSTNDFFSNVTYTVDLRQPAGKRITDLKFANGKKIEDSTPIKLGMNSYRMGHLTQKGGALEGMNFPVLFDTKAEFGDEEGTIRNLTIRYLMEVKKGQYEGKPMKRWQLTGLQGYEKQRAIVNELLNSGKISVPVTDDGRYTNVASINVKDKLFNDKASYDAALKQQQEQLTKATTDVEKGRINDTITLIKALNKF